MHCFDVCFVNHSKCIVLMLEIGICFVNHSKCIVLMMKHLNLFCDFVTCSLLLVYNKLCTLIECDLQLC